MRSATTGSFFAAAEAGIKPLIKVKQMLMVTMAIAELIGKVAIPEMPAKYTNSAFIPMDNK